MFTRSSSNNLEFEKTQPKPSSTASHKNSKRHAVVVHNMMTPTPKEDWILYGDEAITVRHSSIRQRKADKVCRTLSTEKKSCNTKTTRPTMPPTPPGSSPAHSEREKQRNGEDQSIRQNDSNHERQTTFTYLNHREVGDSKSAMRGTTTYRLPTPDLSDVDEDDMWGCCNAGNHRHQ